MLLALLLVAALAPVTARAQSAPSADSSFVAETPDTASFLAEPPDSEEIVPPPPTGTLRVETRPSGLSVEVEGTPVGRSPVGPLALPPGAYRVRAFPADPRRFGTSSEGITVTLTAGKESVARFDLRPPVVLRTDPEPAFAKLTGRPAADSLLGSTPLSVQPSLLETALLRFSRDLFADTTVAGSAFLAGSEPLRVQLRRVELGSSKAGPSTRVPIYRKRWLQWSLVGIGAVLTGAAAVWHREADDAYEKYLDSSNVEEIPGLYDDTLEYDRRATAAFVGGQAAMITGAILLLTGQSH